MLPIILIIVITIILVLIIHGISLSKKDFICKTCGHRFNKEWYELIFLTHYENEYSVCCPECGKKYTQSVDRE